MGAELNKALIALQKELAPIKRNAKGQTGTREHRYADLPAVYSYLLPLLSKHGLAFSARPTRAEDGTFVLAYSLLHSSGEREDGEYPLGAGTPQQNGSAITYARRYSLCAVTGAGPVGEDDDGAAASEAHVNRPRPRATPRAKTTGPDHTQLRKGTVERAAGDRPAQRGPVPPDEDHWDGQPAGDLPRRVNGKVGAIQQHFKRIHVDDRDIRLGYTARLAGLDTLGSTNDLTDDQAGLVLKRIGKCRDEKALRALLDTGDAPEEVTR